MDFMKGIPDKAYDLAIVDPPYGIGHTNNEGQNNLAKVNPDKMKWNKHIPEELYFKEILRVSINQIIWGINYYHYSFLNSSGRIIWNKLTTGDFSDCEIAYSSIFRVVRKFTFRWNGMIQQNCKNRETRIHPTQKPVALYKWLLQNYSKPGQTIFDSHVGSGSIRIACHDMGFEFEGCEIDEDYWKAQEERYKKHAQQSELFVFQGGEIQE
jgi:site-specific DNA-methyltransferase (adenine-specific)